jgi:hypothetical protein
VTISKRMRFEILRRDSYTCRYCGHRAPEVKVVVDHMTPEALGGTDEPTNLVTACVDCNSGKASASADNELVAELDARAQQWQRAMHAAAEMRRRDRDAIDTVAERIRVRWSDYYYAADEDKPDADRRRFLIPDDWRAGVDHFLGAGLPIDDMVELIEVAMRGGLEARVPDGRWRYYMGCCKRVLRELESQAHQLVDAQAQTVAPAHPSTASDPVFHEPTLDDLP